jgi:two-component system response regulator HydG
LCTVNSINIKSIPQELKSAAPNKVHVNVETRLPKGEFKGNLRSAAFMAEYQIILSALQKVNFNKSKAAELLNIDRKTLYNKLKHYELMH